MKFSLFPVACLIAVFSSSVLSNQLHAQMPVKITTFKEVKYKIYPARLPYGEWFKYKWNKVQVDELGEVSSSSTPKYELFFPYNPFPLEDGRYLGYFPKRVRKYYKNTKIPRYSHEDTTLVAVTFNVLNERKNGEALWYNEKGEIIQKGAYVDDVREGEWALFRKDYRVEYSYRNGLLHGALKRYYKEQLICERHFIDGLEVDEGRYYNKKGELEQVKRYVDGKLDEVLKYKKGQLYYHNYPHANDTSYAYFNGKSGSLSKVVFYRPQDSTFEERVWNEHGGLQKVEYRYSTDYVNQSAERLDSGRYLGSLMNIMRRYGTQSSRTYYYESYHENGRPKMAYDFRKTGYSTSINHYDKKGRVIRVIRPSEVQADSGALWLEVESYRAFNKRLYGKEISRTDKLIRVYSVGSSYSIYEEYKDRKGRLITEADPYYLSKRFPDSSGLVLMTSLYPRRKKGVKYYNLLHSRKVVRTVSKRGVPYVEVSATRDEVNQSLFYLTVKEHSKKQKLTLVHQIPVRINRPPKINEHYIEVETQSMLNAPDTIEYQVEFNGVPFSGDIDIERMFGDRLFNIKVVKFREAKGWRRNHLLKLKYYNVESGVTNNWYSDVHTVRGEVTSIDFYDLDFPVKYDKRTKQGEEIVDDEFKFGYFINGQRNGFYTDKRFSAEYFYDTLHGTYINWGYYTTDENLKRQIGARMNYRMDTLNGWFTKYAKPQVYKERIYIRNGYPDGDYFYGNIECPTLTEAKIKNGFLYDTARYYFSEGVLKVKCYFDLEDSNFYAPRPAWEVGFDFSAETNYEEETDDLPPRRCLTGPLNRTKYAPFNFLTHPMHSFDANRTADYIYYYKNGVMSQRGRVEDGFKVGTWDYWDLNGGRMKQIVYGQGEFVDSINDDTISYYGKIKMWYPNGKPLLNGLVLSEFSQFKCDQELAVNFENIYYQEMFDENGGRMLTNNNGQVYEYHNNGELRVEGFIKKGKRDSLWKFYDPDGRLESMGTYSEDEKDGFWVEGDLEAIPHFYDRCVKGQVEPFSLPDAEDQGYITVPVRLTESVYVKGDVRRINQIQLLPLYGDWSPRSYFRYNHIDRYMDSF